MVLKEKELNMKKDNEISVVSSVSDVIDTTSGIVTNIFKAHMSRYENSDKYLSEKLLEHGYIDNKDMEMAAKLYAVPMMHKKYKNIAKTLLKADALCKKNTTNSDKTNFDVDDDWLIYFLDKASVISDDKVQDVFACLISQECSNHGSIRKIMIDRLALLDSISAQFFKMLCQLTYRVIVSDGREYLMPLYLRDGTLVKLVKRKKINFSEKQAINYQNVLTLKGQSAECQLECVESELDILQDIGLISLSEESDECDIYSAKEVVYSFFVEDNKAGELVVYDKRQKIYFVYTGNITFTKMGLDLYNSLKPMIEPYSGLTDILSAYIQLQKT